MASPSFPALYQVNTRVRLQELSRSLGRPATLDDVPDEALDRIAALGFEWLWLLGVWQTGPLGREVSLRQPQWRAEYARTLPAFTDADVSGSPFAIQAYEMDRILGGTAALARIRERLKKRNLKLLLDFVPNHTALDHPWVKEHPEYYIQGSDGDLQREPQNYRKLDTNRGPIVFAHGRDPYFPGWPDTLQLNYRHAGMRQALSGELRRIASQCDGVRCDMAMLVLPDIFRRTWGDRAQPRDGSAPVDAPFWPEVIPATRQVHPGFLFLAEVYWDLEWVLQQQGFDYTYDKRLYDRLRARDASGVRGHLHAEPDFQNHSARFLENHDEPRAAGVFPPDVHRAAAVITFLVPGMRFLHEGQLEGRKVHVSMHLNRRPDEPVDTNLPDFYRRLLECVCLPAARTGRWSLLDCQAAWNGNPTWLSFIAFTWDGPAGERLLTAVNYGPSQGQCYVGLAFPDLRGRRFVFADRMSAARFERNGDDLAARGLYLDMPAWGYYVFAVTGA
jgi:glycosidase